jgi:hypothetical protein
VDLFGFVSWCLAVIAVVTLAWPVNGALMALAFKVRQGTTPITMEPSEFWWRCIFAALGVAICTLILIGLNYVLVPVILLPRGMVQVVLLLAYVPAAIGFLFWMLALEDMLQAASVFLLYILLPGLPLLLIGRLTGLWEFVRQTAPWLLPPT